MDFFFKSDGCPSCEILKKILLEKEKSWSGCLKFVDVEFDKNGKLITYIDGKLIEDAPVGRVPAYYDSVLDKLYIGADDTYEGITNASWYNKSKIHDKQTSDQQTV